MYFYVLAVLFLTMVLLSWPSNGALPLTPLLPALAFLLWRSLSMMASILSVSVSTCGCSAAIDGSNESTSEAPEAEDSCWPWSLLAVFP